MNSNKLIQYIQTLIDAQAGDYKFKIYDSLSMDYEHKDPAKINGIANVTNGLISAIPGLVQQSITISVKFIYPVQRLEYVKDVLERVAAASAGVVVQNSIIDPTETGSTGVNIVYPIENTRQINTVGETIAANLYCYFVVNDKMILANDIKLDIGTGVYQEDSTVTAETVGIYWYKDSSGNWIMSTLPADYVEGRTYYTETTESVAFTQLKINRTLHGETDNYDNNIESQTINTYQVLGLTFLAPYVKGTMLSKIKRKLLLGGGIDEDCKYNFYYDDREDDVPYVFQKMTPTNMFGVSVTRGESVVPLTFEFAYRRD